MKIKHKFLIITVINIIILVAITYFMFQFSYFTYINRYQEHYISQNFSAINSILDNEKHNLSNIAFTLSHLDETYDFNNQLNYNYMSNYLSLERLRSLDLTMIAFLDKKGTLLYKTHPENDLTSATHILGHLNTDKRHLEDIFSSDPNYVHAGLLNVDERNYIVAISPITKSLSSERNGYLVMVREFQQPLTDVLKNTYNVSITHMQNYATYRSRTIKDINGSPSMAIIISDHHTDFNFASYYTKIFAISLLLFVLLTYIVNIIIIDKLILKRLHKLSSFLDTVATTKDTVLSLEMQGNDEFNEVAMSLNHILKEFHTVYQDINEMENRYVQIMEATNDGYLALNISTKEIYISPKWKEMIDYKGDNPKELFLNYSSKIHPDCLPNLKSTFKLIKSGLSDYFQVEYKVIKSSGSYIWVLHRGKIVEKDENGNPLRLISTLTNITDRKRHEDEISFLSYSDRLTGLNNRAYMENKLKILDDSLNSNYFIIMADINGLKLVNDNLGYKEGDRLLHYTSSILKTNCSSDDIISRWGGDAFVILCKNKDLNYVFDLVDSIKKDCNKASSFPFKVSVALGYARNTARYSNTQAVMGLAEKRMYRNKLLEPRSARSATIMSLSRSLYEKHNETEEHTMRIRNLSLKLGKMLYLSHDILDELELLSLLHDIGKIGIPDHILMKPSKLNDDEWEIMKTHTSIGYRIAQSTPELAHIADEILAHHERYDGQGYPNGLKGDEIPLLSRIINVIDSFDVMTYRRIYKEAFTVEAAVEELKRCSGTQFDAFIVQKFIKLLEEEKAI